jgi:glycogen operon protein
MPAAAWIDERHLAPPGLTNYWGYNPVAFMAPDLRLAPGGWGEVRAATDALAVAGIECVLDVVLNHTGEGDALGPTLSLRGLDNATYYRLRVDDPAVYVDDTGTGGTLALDRPAPVRLAMDALRAWRRLGGMAGFRFDLATVLGRVAGGSFDPAAPLLTAIGQDPELRALKLIAEPWDVGPGGYQLGRFPPAWAEWNDRFRDTVRGFWRGDAVSLGELARRLAGSQDVLAGRRPSRSVNFVVAHDGFTLADLVAYREKHNLANGEQGRDGTDANRSWNNGVEGPTDDGAILAARLADQRALLAQLLLARGAPMLAMGAELGHSQGGNNNAYAQDNPVGWLDWAAADAGLLAFAARLVAIRRAHPALRADRFLTGEPAAGADYPDVAWRRADGAALDPADWDDPQGQTLAMVLATPGPGGLDRVAVITHRGPAAAHVALPSPRYGFAWSILADSVDPGRDGRLEGAALTVAGRSVAVLAEVPIPARRGAGADPEILGRLAAAAGIAPAWWSLDGERHQVRPDTQQALLAAMGWPAATSRQALEQVRRLADSHDRRPLPFAMVARTGAAAQVPLRFDPAAGPPLTWVTVEGEDGRLQRLRIGPPTGGAAETEVGRDGRSCGLLRLELPPLAPGRWRLTRDDHPDIVCQLTIAPPACFAPPGLRDGARLFGLTAQLYALRRRGDQGIGDFTTLGDLGAAAARDGAAMLAINPMHALFGDRRDRASPYYPSDRRFLDPIYLDIDPIAAGDLAAIREMRARPTIDYPAVWGLKAAALEASFERAADPPGLADFIAAGGEALARFATFQAIAETRPGVLWQEWPLALRDPASPQVDAFAAAHGRRVRFHQYLQWLCERALADAAAQASGLRLGLCRDLAVGAAPDGAEAWSDAAVLASGVAIGAPPDEFNAEGQVWGVPPFDPLRLQQDGYARSAELFACNMRHAGALRIDHVMGLARLFWIPDGARPADGAYVAYPRDDLLGQLALESQRARCLVIGEDLGTVPAGLRETLMEQDILSCRVLPFEHDGGAVRPPGAYPRLAVACVSTHDLPPFAGWWEGADIAERLHLKLTGPEEAERATAQRLAEKSALLGALEAAGLIESGREALGTPASEVVAAAHAFVAATPSFLALAQVEDLAGERVATNLPGTDSERPNWRRRLGSPLDGLMASDAAQAILRAIRAARAG